MTIGIAACGPRAGLAVVKALAAVEAVGRGAIGGYVSLVALAASGEVLRAEVQRGGSGQLFPGSVVPDAIATAMVAGLMSSGPDRPEPLSQFTPAAAGVGLVTGHRMPNTIGASGVHLNAEVLALMGAGATPEDAVAVVVAANPGVDAGIIALDVAGRIAAADTAHVARRGDTGRALVMDHGLSVAVLHNAIRPHRPLATLVTEVALDVMRPVDHPDGWITFSEGVALAAGPSTSVEIDAGGLVQCIVVDDPKLLSGSWSFGIGYETPVKRGLAEVGVALYEPYMLVDHGRISSIDGRSRLAVPYKAR